MCECHALIQMGFKYGSCVVGKCKQYSQLYSYAYVTYNMFVSSEHLVFVPMNYSVMLMIYKRYWLHGATQSFMFSQYNGV